MTWCFFIIFANDFIQLFLSQHVVNQGGGTHQHGCSTQLLRIAVPRWKWGAMAQSTVRNPYLKSTVFGTHPIIQNPYLKTPRTNDCPPPWIRVFPNLKSYSRKAHGTWYVESVPKFVRRLFISFVLFWTWTLEYNQILGGQGKHTNTNMWWKEPNNTSFPNNYSTV